MSSFREAIFVDADAFFSTDPASLLEDEQYISTGALFFKDRNLSPESKRSWLNSILLSPMSDNVKRSRMWTGESGHMMDSGVIVVDKWRHFIPLLLATRLNGPDRDGDQAAGKRGVYDMVYGDKETFWLSWELCGDLEYAFRDSLAGSMGTLATVHPSSEGDSGEEPQATPKPASGPMVCSPQLLHFDRDGKPLWFNGWISRNKDSRTEWQDFDVYLKELPEAGRRRKHNSWTISPANLLCLEAEDSYSFASQDQAKLDDMLRLGRENTALFDDT